MVQNAGGTAGGSIWYRLTPDIHGSYNHGTWSNLASDELLAHYFSSQVLKRMQGLVAGGEIWTGGSPLKCYIGQKQQLLIIPVFGGVD